jgi:hypothetical protein
MASGTRLVVLWRSSMSLSVPSTCSRRDFCALRVGRAAIGSARATLAMRRSAFRSPEMIG